MGQSGCNFQEPVVTLRSLNVGPEYGHMTKLGLGPATAVFHEITFFRNGEILDKYLLRKWQSKVALWT